MEVEVPAPSTSCRSRQHQRRNCTWNGEAASAFATAQVSLAACVIRADTGENEQGWLDAGQCPGGKAALVVAFSVWLSAACSCFCRLACHREPGLRDRGSGASTGISSLVAKRKFSVTVRIRGAALRVRMAGTWRETPKAMV